jgi:hypothetical protein
MDSNTHSDPPPELPEPPVPVGPLGGSDRLAGLPAVLDELAAEDLDQLTDSARGDHRVPAGRQAGQGPVPGEGDGPPSAASSSLSSSSRA